MNEASLPRVLRFPAGGKTVAIAADSVPALARSCKALSRIHGSRWAVAAVLCALSAAEANAQTLATGVLSGVVRDPTGAPLTDVELSVTDQGVGGLRVVSVGRDGTFRVAPLPPGSYSVRADRLGYHPKQIDAVPLRPGERVELVIQLTPATPPIELEVVRFEGGGVGSRAGFGQWLSTLPLERLPWERRELGEVAGLSTTTTDALEVEGLPASLSTLMIDGVRFTPVRHPDLDRGDVGVITLPLSAFEAAELVTADPDMDWTGFSSGALSVHTRRGTPDLAARAFGSWSGGPLRSSQLIDGSSPSNSSFWGGGVVGGPILQDTAHFVIGFEARRLETPRPRAWALDPTIGAEVLAAGRAHSVGLEAYTRPFVLQTTVVSGFGRFDWQLGSGNVLSVRAGFGGLLPVGKDAEVARSAVPGAVAEGGDLLLSAALSSTIAGGWAHEIRVGVSRGTREYEPEAEIGAAPVLPSTRVVSGGLSFGADPRLPGTFQRTDFTTAQSLEVSSGAHRLKFGLDTEISSHDDTYSYARRAEYVFGGPQEFADAEGSVVQTQTASPQATFTRLGFGAYVQNTWNAAPGLLVVGGLRFDVESIPSDKVRLSQRWFDYTGLANTDVPARVTTVSPRLGVTWDVGGEGIWTVRASAGVYSQRVPSEALAELITVDGTPTVRRAVGELDAWPTLPSAPGVPSDPSRLTLLGPDFRGPVTGRASFGVSHLLTRGTTLHFAATYRETEFLPRRSDLNRLSTSTATDQHGRPIYGPLVQLGQLVASPRPNRRFGDFDVVSALNADGWSRYWGITGALEHDAGDRLGLFARYTYSHTTDNWLALSDGGPDAQITPFADRDADDWRDATSDYDLTHRFAAGAELRFPGAFEPRLAGVYRYRSGYPFTPGFRTGVDVNGDGSGRNDPAFIDPSISGVSSLMGTWSCLNTQSGRFAERNSCREPGVHALDARFGLRLGGTGGASAEIFAEGLNLVDPGVGQRDAALYRIDESRALIEDPVRRVVTLPLIANPDFGKLLGRVGTGRTLRFGLQVTF